LDDRSRSVAAREHDRSRREAAKRALKHPEVRFTGIQARAIGEAFGEFVIRNGITVWACAILPDHVHLIVAGLRYKAEILAEQLKGAATRRLVRDGIHPFGKLRLPNGRVPKCWGRGGWQVFLDSGDEIENAISYVEGNPEKEGLARQRWSFVVPFQL
jgi:REP element-mobilizing transposase RayT